jgi:hypothetical protein
MTNDRNGAKAVGPAKIGPSAQFEGGNLLRRNGGAYAPRSLNFQTGMPSRLALSARLSWMPVQRRDCRGSLIHRQKAPSE